jgi:hypothetical protein
MKWTEMSPRDKDALIFEKVMEGHAQCTTTTVVCRMLGETFLHWSCPTCGAEGTDRPVFGMQYVHDKPGMPAYTTSMDAAWQIMDHLKPGRAGVDAVKTEDHETFMRRAVFVNILDTHGFGSWWSWPRERLCAEICKAALIACGVEIED